MVKVDASLIEAVEPPPPPLIHYPESDGKPMADNDWQREWIVKIIINLQVMFANRHDVYVSGDLFWYPVEGNNRIVQAPDTLVAFGRPPGPRGCYKQWEEGGIAPQVVFEILSPNNTGAEMLKRLQFYNAYGVEEYYVYDPDDFSLEVWIRKGARLTEVPTSEWVSPRLGVRFKLEEDGLVLYRPDGTPFRSALEINAEAEFASARAAYESQRAEEERRRADEERLRADQQQQKAELLAARLRALGIDPDSEVE